MDNFHFILDPDIDINELDIAVNAVATAVKDFFFKKIPPILNPDHMTELEVISVMMVRLIYFFGLAEFNFNF